MSVSTQVAELEAQVAKLRTYASFWKMRSRFLETICDKNNIDWKSYFKENMESENETEELK